MTNTTFSLPTVLAAVLASICDVRMNGRSSTSDPHYWAKWGAANGQIFLLRSSGALDWDAEQLLRELLESASEYAGNPFPSLMNVGPLIPRRVSFDRSNHGARI